MVDSVRLLNVAEDAGFKERITYYLCKKAAAVLNEATPDANELTLAKNVLYPSNANNAGVSSIVQTFAWGFVTTPTVSSNLISASFDHLAFTDTQLETQVNSFWTTYAKGVS